MPPRRLPARTRAVLIIAGACVAASLAVAAWAAPSPSLRARYSYSPAHPVAGVAAVFDASRSTCGRRPCRYRWTAMRAQSTKGHRTRRIPLTVRVRANKRTTTLGRRRVLRFSFAQPGTYYVGLDVTDRRGRRSRSLRRVRVDARAAQLRPSPAISGLPHDPSFVGPEYYRQWANGPSSSPTYFPILAYHIDEIGQWGPLAGRMKAMGVNGVYWGYETPTQSTMDAAAAAGFTGFAWRPGVKIESVRRNGGVIRGYAMDDEPNQDSSKYSPANDPAGTRYAADANAQRDADPTRPMIGNFTKDVEDWAFASGGLSDAAYQQHLRTQLGALDLTSADVYGWTDPYEWAQAGGTGTTHVGAWVYGHTIERLRSYNPRAPAFAFVECCTIESQSPKNMMMPGMLESAVWNLLVHGARGFTYWPRDFYHADDRPYPGATYTESYSLFGDHQWDAQYERAKQVDGEVLASAVQLNSPTMAGISASGSDGVPVAALGKDDSGKLWLLAQADGDGRHPLSNTAPMTGTIQLPDVVPAGTVLEVVGENRSVTVNAAHQIQDTFGTTTETPTYSGTPLTYGYQKHIYRQP